MLNRNQYFPVLPESVAAQRAAVDGNLGPTELRSGRSGRDSTWTA